MEKLFLCGFLANNKLNVINKKNVYSSVFFTKFGHSRSITTSNGFNYFISKLFRSYIKDFHIWILFQNKMSDRVHQMGFAKSGSSIQVKRIIGFARGFRNCKGCGMGKVVVFSDDKGIEGVTRI